MGLLFGRDTIAFYDGTTKIELNATTDLNHTYSSQVTQFPVEKALNKIASISDHVVPGNRNISLNCIISSSTSISSFSSVSVDEKLTQLIQWQSNGTLLTLQGYETDGLIEKILERLPSSFRYIPPDDPDKRYLGRSYDSIPNLVLGDVTFKEAHTTSKDVTATLTLIPILIAEAKTTSSPAQNTSSVPQNGSTPLGTRSR